MTQIKTKPTKEPRSRFDLIEGILKEEYNRHANEVAHYYELESIAESERGKTKWAHLRRLAQKLKDDILAALYAWQQSKTLKAIDDAFRTARDERRALLNWLADRPQEDPRHAERAASEIGYFAGVYREILYTARDRVSRKSIQREAEALLVTLKAN